MIMKTQKQPSTPAQASKMMKAELKNAFPETKFSVRVEHYTSINVNWTDGPTANAVEEIIKKFQYGHFDGMTDSYEYSNSNEDLPQVRFVFANRTMSAEAQAQIIEAHNNKFVDEAQIKDLQGYNQHMNEWNNTLVYRAFVKLDLREVAQ